MDSTTVALHVVSLVLSLLCPVALFVVAVAVVRPRRRTGWLLIACAAALELLVKASVPMASYIFSLVAGRTNVVSVERIASFNATVGLAGNLLWTVAVGLLILGIVRLAKIPKAA